jgi:hypothetical protein
MMGSGSVAITPIPIPGFVDLIGLGRLFPLPGLPPIGGPGVIGTLGR